MIELDSISVQSARNELYDGKGYVIVRNAISGPLLEHLQRFWSEGITSFQYRSQVNKYRDIRLQGPDLSVSGRGQSMHYNFFWNEGRDMATYHLAWRLQAMRNKIEGRPEDWGYLPVYRTPGERKDLRYVSSYRVVATKEGHAVPAHCDWDLDHSRLQMSLMLSTWGTDYKEGGFLFSDRFRGGKLINLSGSENLQAGDLLIFRYAHPHGVGRVRSPDGERGFVRMLMPVEVLDQRDKSLLYRVGKNALLREEGYRARLIGNKPEYARILTRGRRMIRGQGDALYYDKEIGKMMAMAVREGLSPSHVYLFKGLWGRFREFQQWQFEALARHGLQPHHNVLDIGCGILRLGMALVPYLDQGRYCGIDPVGQYLAIGRKYLEMAGHSGQRAELLCDRNFSFDRFGRKFDLSMAQSVFTHLSPEQVEACFSRLSRVMKPGGKLLFTIVMGKEEQTDILYIDQEPVTKTKHADLDFYRGMAAKFHFDLDYRGRADHPSQHVCVATF